ncbi:hypothetical protein BDA99DRAFT_521269 [Phascolomyces articulosus]|uniref:Chromatin modification-related protein n=1 Tax=Phascolomyces articulosus TaxID=60185 RepID=A0AAD5K305_9FUNG|nr:hypothetical protein BDA99DRAFT_521269 [Phascolomyces articulosus]
MSMSIADIFEDYVESLQNLPGEIDQNMQELRNMDEEFQRIRETYTKLRRSHSKVLRTNNANPPANFAQSRTQLDKEYKKAVQKQDQKIELALRMYDLVSKHIERIDSQMAKSGIDGDWINNNANGTHGSAIMNGAAAAAGSGRRRLNTSSSASGWDDGHWRNGTESGPRKRSSLGPSSIRKRPNPSTSHHGSLAELEIDPNEPRYCICNQVSFGDMVACDGENCEKEWFHYACVGLVEPPAGKWYCDDCANVDDGYRKRLKRLSDDII